MISRAQLRSVAWQPVPVVMGTRIPSVNDLRLSIVKLQARMKQTNRMTDRRRESNAECSQYGTKPILLMFLPIFTPFYIAIINTSK